jgi:hypothetical protein
MKIINNKGDEYSNVKQYDSYNIYINKKTCMLIGICEEFEVELKYFCKDSNELSDENESIGIEIINDIMKLNQIAFKKR